MNFHDTSFPKFLETFVVGSCNFSTSKEESMSGRESRNSDSGISKKKYDLRNCYLSSKEFEIFNSFFQARRGMRFSFRLKDRFDFQGETEIIGVGDGKKLEFQLQKSYDDLISPYIRIITKPVPFSVKLFCKNRPIQPDHVDFNTGKIYLSEAIEQGAELIANFDFDIAVRFTQDSFKYSFDENGSILLEDVQMVEVHE